MKLTEEQAIDMTIELWKAIVELGLKDKGAWEGWAKYGHIRNDCPLCEYMRQQLSYVGGCHGCPYVGAYGSCMAGGSPFISWDNTRYSNPEAARGHAKDFLLQLYELKLKLLVKRPLTMKDWSELAEEIASPSKESLAQQALDLIEKVMNFEDDEPDLDADASLQDIIDALVAARGAILAELDC